ncbi:MAG: VCBS repeat-containing protein [Saprospiraceae bacterium]
MIFISCKTSVTEKPIFKLLSAAHTNINFNNTIAENDTFNMYAFMNIYTGGGVGVGDINNDGLEDVFFSGNRVSSKLYLNKGNLKFEDITESAGVETSKWCAGVSMVDINADGWLDIYISVTGIGTDEQRANILFENQKDGTFIDKAKFYGLDDSRQIMHTSFFDYDNDNDLDAFMIVNPVNYSLANVNNIRPKQTNGESESTDRLYRNDGSVFTEIGEAAGILFEGYSLGVSTCDINGDGWQDIYVSNDFLTNDILYLNNQDGTFYNNASTSLDHTSFAGMGNDISDFNNDGLPDIFVVDMLPEDNERRQLIIPSSSYDKFELTQKMEYEPQYTRNTLQLNRGDGTFSEIGQMAGIDKTDWSWSSLFADLDNDGDKDLFVTNGFLRDVGNLDYISYQRKNNASPFGKKGESHKNRLKAIQDLGAAKIQNYVFENNANSNHLTFNNKSNEWGITQKTCSNGAVFADLDNDGDLEMVINNVNDRAFIYENKTNELTENHFLKITLHGNENNPNGIGAKIKVLINGEQQFYQHNIYRGYESSVSQQVHFGLGENDLVKKIEVIWADGKSEIIKNVSADRTISVFYKNAKQKEKSFKSTNNNIFTSVEKETGLEFLHQENDYVDFKIQPLLPHKHSQNGPGIAIGDVNGDGLEDVYIGGSGSFAGQLFFQKSPIKRLVREDEKVYGKFEKITQDFDAAFEDMGSLFFDAEGDGDLDLYIVSGGSSFPKNSNMYQDRLYVNDGKGNFTRNEKALPQMFSSGANVNAVDFDKDGDLDLFVGGRIVPGGYPTAAQSYLLRNDSKNGNIVFTNISKQYLPQEGRLGMVTSALWTDYDNDGWQDLMIVGEWMSIQFLKNQNGEIQNSGPKIPNSSGWWNSISSGDFDADGDTDYVMGNLGLNSCYQASEDKPVCVYANDYDKNGRIDPVMCQYIGDENYILHPRDLLIQQINAMRVRFRSYASYGKTPFRKSFAEEELEVAHVLKTTTFASSYLENLGDGKFELRNLPMPAQVAPIFGIQVEDLDHDGNLDLMMVGNSYSTEVGIGRYDACKGLILSGDGNGNFSQNTLVNKGFFVDSDVKGLSRLMNGYGDPLYLTSSNSDYLKVFSKQRSDNQEIIQVKDSDVYILLENVNGELSKHEIYHGSGYLSQSSRSIYVDEKIKKATIFNSKGEGRNFPLRLNQIGSLN